MNIFVERWCASRARTRALIAGLLAGIMALAGWGLLVKPVQRQHVALEARLDETMQATSSLWSAVRRFPPVVTPDAPQMKAPFSPLDFQGSGTRLVHWKPAGGGGALTLEADWAQIPAIFARLAQREAVVGEFDIHPHGARLRLNLQLELPHAR